MDDHARQCALNLVHAIGRSVDAGNGIERRKLCGALHKHTVLEQLKAAYMESVTTSFARILNGEEVPRSMTDLYAYSLPAGQRQMQCVGDVLDAAIELVLSTPTSLYEQPNVMDLLKDYLLHVHFTMGQTHGDGENQEIEYQAPLCN